MTLVLFILCFLGLMSSVDGFPRMMRPRIPIIKTTKKPWNFTCILDTPAGNHTWPHSNSPQAAGHQAGQQPIMTPIRIDYVLAESTTREYAFLMMDIFRRLNSFLSERIKTDPMPLDAMLFNSEGPRTLGPCALEDNVRCSEKGARVPAEYLANCWQPIRGLSTRKSEHHKLKASMDISLIVYVRVFNRRHPGRHMCDEWHDNARAYSTPCMWNTQQKFRPIHGGIAICNSPTDFEPDHLFSIMLHETLHILTGRTLQAYTTTEYADGTAYMDEHESRKQRLLGTTWRKTVHWNWTDQDGTKENIYAELVSTPTVLDEVRNYFNCYSGRRKLLGAEVNRKWEDQMHKVDDAHWSQRLFPDEVLAPMVYGPDAVLSSLTLAVLKDTGWYEVNMSMAQPMLFDASRVMTGTTGQFGREYCHLAWTSCWDVLKEVMEKWYQNPNFLEFAGPYCDPTGAVSTRACSSDGRLRLRCHPGGYTRTMGCPIYLKNATMDANNIDCMGQERTWEETIDRVRLDAYAYPATCVTFTKNDPATGPSDKNNYPACYEFNCSTETKTIDIHLFKPRRCILERACGFAITTWPHSCPTPFTGEVVWPDYVNVCEKPDGVGAITWVDPTAAARETSSDSEGTSAGSILWRSKELAGVNGLCLAMFIAYWSAQ